MKNFSAVILTHNEEKNIYDCLEALSELHDIVLVDDKSDDRTLEIVGKFPNVRIFKRNLDGDFSSQRNFGLSKAKNEWALFLDADERMSEKLLDEISSNISKQDYAGFYIKRTDILWGHKLKHGETRNIRLLRLARKKIGKWHGSVHEEWKIKGRVGFLDNEIVHYPHQTIKEFLREINNYSTIRAKELLGKNTNVGFIEIISYPGLKFMVNYIIKMGFLDGIPGFVQATMMSLHSFLVRSKLWLLKNQPQHSELETR